MYQGIIVFMLCDIGSKSECQRPFLYRGGGEFIRLRKVGDNPFENESFRPFDALAVSLTGETDEFGTLCVTEITRCGAPNTETEDNKDSTTDTTNTEDDIPNDNDENGRQMP